MTTIGPRRRHHRTGPRCEGITQLSSLSACLPASTPTSQKRHVKGKTLNALLSVVRRGIRGHCLPTQGIIEEKDENFTLPSSNEGGGGSCGVSLIFLPARAVAGERELTVLGSLGFCKPSLA